MTEIAYAPPAKELIAQAVSHLGLVRVFTTAIAAWWQRPRLPQDLPNHVRADLGLPGCSALQYPSSAPDIRLHYR